MVGKISDEIKTNYYVLNGYATRKQESFKVNGETIAVEIRDIQIKRKWLTKDKLQIRMYTKMGLINNEQEKK